MTKENLIWMAGFFDGEGNIHLRYTQPTYSNSRGQYTLWVNIAQANKDILIVFEIFGGKIYENTWSLKKYYYWRITGLKAKPFLEAILPYLKLKESIVKIALQFIDTLTSREYGNKLGLSQDLINKRIALIEEFRKFQPISSKGRKPKTEVEAKKIKSG